MVFCHGQLGGRDPGAGFAVHLLGGVDEGQHGFCATFWPYARCAEQYAIVVFGMAGNNFHPHAATAGTAGVVAVHGIHIVVLFGDLLGGDGGDMGTAVGVIQSLGLAFGKE